MLRRFSDLRFPRDWRVPDTWMCLVEHGCLGVIENASLASGLLIACGHALKAKAC